MSINLSHTQRDAVPFSEHIANAFDYTEYKEIVINLY